MKFVYVLISNEGDYFVEQAFASIYSLRLHNPDAEIILVSDADTWKSLKGERGRIKDRLHGNIVVDVPTELSNLERNRYIKTSLRQYVSGDYVYIDNNTLVCASLKDINNCDGIICAVQDKHERVANIKELKDYLKITKKEYWGYDKYFNTGVILVRENEKSLKFYEDWHKLWLRELRHYAIKEDQSSFAQTNEINNHLIAELNGKYNCQLASKGNYKYLAGACILHYPSLPAQKDDHPFPLCNEKYLREIRAKGITQQVLNIIKNPRETFLLYHRIIGKMDIDIYNTPMAILGRKISRDFKWTNSIMRAIYRLMGYRV